MDADPTRGTLLAELKVLGARRAEHSTSRRTAGRIALDAVYADIRAVVPEAERVGLTRIQVAEALGIGRAALYNILSGKAGG